MNRKLTLVASAVALCCLGFLALPPQRSTASALPQYQAQSQAQTITCSSDDMHRHTCEVDARGGAQLVRQISGSPCVFGRTWGYDARGIWVDRGCRAEFQVGTVNWGGWDSGYSVYCASDDGGRHFCPTSTNNGVRLARQRSQAECIFGRTWGYTRRGIWVDQGCRADFDLGGYSGNGGGQTQVVSCSSDDMRWHTCQADTSGGARLLRQRSEADCVYGSTWGYDDRGIWVDRGCRAEFEVGGDQYSDEQDPAYTVNIYCSSDDMHRRSCYTGPHGAIRLIKRHSEAECLEGRTWGHDPRGIWVDRGCRADFEVLVGGYLGGNANNYAPAVDWNTGSVSVVTCSSDDMHRHTCAAETRWGVRLVKQRSGSPCDQGRTWGYDNNGIWVDRGCRADFEVLAQRR
ncbi:MAG TPA: DUF3011 domain-containing protein [Candidatus Acidoferrum sp.]|nr:DUF3011 domain-containing protein [Candidatus Acidoferrum sp.]